MVPPPHISYLLESNPDLLLDVLDGVLVGVADDVGSPAGSVNDDAGDSLLETIFHDPDCILPTLQEQRHNWNVHPALYHA